MRREGQARHRRQRTATLLLVVGAHIVLVALLRGVLDGNSRRGVATRRAIRAIARAPSLSEQLARSRDEPHRPNVQERLGNAVKTAGKGDCLKGEYAGAGMGLLSLPFLAVAEARGDCAQ